MPEQSPARRTVQTTIAVPASTLPTAPQISAYDLGDVLLERLEVIIPDGHAGLTGIAVVYDGQGVVPWATTPVFLIGNGETPTFDVDFRFGHPAQVWAYNEGVYAHSFYLRATVRDSTLDVRASVDEGVMVVANEDL